MTQQVVLRLTGDASGLKRALDTVDKELADVVRQADRAQAALGPRMAAQTGKATKAMNQYSNSMNRVFKTSGQARAGLQNIGFQMQDIAVQAEMGTHWTRIFAQQGTQILGVFGPMATILGAVAAALIAAGNAMGWFSTETKDAQKSLEEFNKASESLAAVEEALGTATRYGVEQYRALLEVMRDVEQERLRLAKEQLNEAIGLQQAMVGYLAKQQVSAQLQLKQAEFSAMGLDTLNEAVFVQERFNRVMNANMEDRQAVISSVIEELKYRGVLTAEVQQTLVMLAETLGVQSEITDKVEAEAEAIVNVQEGAKRTKENVEALGIALTNAEAISISLAGSAWDAAKAYATAAYNAAILAADPSPVYSGRGSGAEYENQKDLDFFRKQLEDAEEFGDGTKPKKKKSGGSGKSEAEREAERIAKAVEKAKEQYEQAVDVQQQWHDVMTDMGTQAIDGFVDSLFDAEKSFGDFAKSLIIDMGKIIARQIIMNALMSAFGGGSASAGMAQLGSLQGVIQSMLGVGRVEYAKGGVVQRAQGFAKGGIVNGATAFPMTGGMGVMGEAGPEAIMPVKTRSDGTLGVAGPSVQINNYSGQEVQVTRSDDEVIEIAVGRARQAIAQDYAMSMQSGHGTYSNAMEQSYNQRRKAV